MAGVDALFNSYLPFCCEKTKLEKDTKKESSNCFINDLFFNDTANIKFRSKIIETKLNEDLFKFN